MLKESNWETAADDGKSNIFYKLKQCCTVWRYVVERTTRNTIAMAIAPLFAEPIWQWITAPGEPGPPWSLHGYRRSRRRRIHQKRLCLDRRSLVYWNSALECLRKFIRYSCDEICEQDLCTLLKLCVWDCVRPEWWRICDEQSSDHDQRWWVLQPPRPPPQKKPSTPENRKPRLP